MMAWDGRDIAGYRSDLVPALRTLFLLVGLVSAVSGCGPIVSAIESANNKVANPPPYQVSAGAAALHDRLIVADMHADSLLANRDLSVQASRGHADLPRLAAGGVAIQTFAAVTNKSYCPSKDDCRARPDLITALAMASGWPVGAWFDKTDRAIYQAEKLAQLPSAAPGRIVLVRSRQDLISLLRERRNSQDKLGALLAIEGGHALEGDIGNVDRLYGAGFRMMGLVHFYDNALGGSTHGIDKGGLTNFGARVIARMEQLGMLVDLAHASEALIRDVLAVAGKPVVVSHTGVNDDCDNRRNLSDAQIRSIVSQGGLIGIGFWDDALWCPDGSSSNPNNDAKAYATRIARAILHVARQAEMVAPSEKYDHVALGSDFDGYVRVGFDARGVPLVTEALLGAGLSEQAIAKIIGGNFCRQLLKGLAPGNQTLSPVESELCDPRPLSTGENRAAGISRPIPPS